MGLGRSLLVQAAPSTAARGALAARELGRRRLVLSACSAHRHGFMNDASGAPAMEPPTAAGGEAAGLAAASPIAVTATAATATAIEPADEEDVPLGSDGLQRYIELHGVAAEFVPPINGAPPPLPRCCELKTLVFLVDSHPIVRFALFDVPGKCAVLGCVPSPGCEGTLGLLHMPAHFTGARPAAGRPRRRAAAGGAAAHGAQPHAPGAAGEPGAAVRLHRCGRLVAPPPLAAAARVPSRPLHHQPTSPTRAVGNVPPFGHRRQLPVIVDTSVTAYTSCYAGGGSEDAELLLAVPELLRAARATVADICRSGPDSSGSSSTAGTLSSPGSSATSSLDSSSAGSLPASAAEEDGAACERQEAAAVAAAAMPLPWEPGQVDVTIEGVVAHRRKIARLLLFANLVPLAALEQAAAVAAPSPKVRASEEACVARRSRACWAMCGAPSPCPTCPVLHCYPCSRAQLPTCAACGGIPTRSSPLRCSSSWGRRLRGPWAGTRGSGLGIQAVTVHRHAVNGRSC